MKLHTFYKTNISFNHDARFKNRNILKQTDLKQIVDKEWVCNESGVSL